MANFIDLHYGPAIYQTLAENDAVLDFIDIHGNTYYKLSNGQIVKIIVSGPCPHHPKDEMLFIAVYDGDMENEDASTFLRRVKEIKNNWDKITY